ncbi:MAG TPA: tyrosine--tRNA ligase, partial [Ruminococcaceae bacterium]|nr:tyrosine--tRNA ligase [Oscillospiraceae bacterium]
EFYQYWRNVGDDDVIKCMKLLTFIPMDEIREYEKFEGAQLNKAKEVLAFELTKMIHGEDEANKAQDAAKALFAGGSDNSNMPTTVLADEDFTDGEITVLDMMLKAGMIKSKGEGRRLIDQGGVSVNDEKVNGALTTLKLTDFDNEVIVKKGKKMFHKFTK